MLKILNRLTDWLYASTLATMIDFLFVAKYPVTYAEVVEFDPNVRDQFVTCGICTALRTMVITALVMGLIWWIV